MSLASSGLGEEDKTLGGFLLNLSRRYVNVEGKGGKRVSSAEATQKLLDGLASFTRVLELPTANVCTQWNRK